ncbi:Hint domain-containing protein [Bradyrhizobium cenepequi]
MVLRSGDGLPPPASLARRHFMRIFAASAGRLSTIAISSAVLAGCKGAAATDTPAQNDPQRGNGHHCFGPGTLILTAHGEVPIEELAIGELVMTTNGPLPVRWVGRRTIKRNGQASWHPSVMPIRVARFAINDQTPRRDLYLSQEHSLLVDGVLIPVKHLVNERSIAVHHDAKTSETIEYFCVKLDTHQVIFAEGTAAETFQYCGGQIDWDNLGDYQDLYGCEHEAMPAFAPHCRYSGGRAELQALLRLAASRFVEMRDPIQIAYARIATRSMSIAA